MYKSRSSVPKERCSAKGSFSTTGRRPEAATAVGSTAEDLVGPAHATLPCGDAGVARFVHRYCSISGAKYFRIADRHQGITVKHEGSYVPSFQLIDFLL